MDENKSIVIWRVRILSCDGGRIGRSWSDEFFLKEDSAKMKMNQLIRDSDERNPQHLFKTSQETIENTVGICNRHLGIMLVVDSVLAR